MNRSAHTPARTTRRIAVSALAAATTLALGAPHAQVRVEAQSAEIWGRAPVVTIGSVDNETVAGQAPAVGHTLKANATVVDPDDDAITSTTYRWKRGATEVGTGEEYATTPADTGQTLTVEVTATTDAAITDPAMGSATREVAVSANTAPTVLAGSVDISGTYAVGETLTATYLYDDADKDAEDESGAVYSWYISHPTTGAPTLIEGATGRTYQLRASDQGENRRIWFSVDKVKSLTGTPNERLRPASPAGQWQATRIGQIAGNSPVAAPTITGASMVVGAVLTAHPGYEDADGDLIDESGTTYLWCSHISNNPTPAGCDVESADKKTWTITAGNIGRQLSVQVRPKASTGTVAGTMVESAKTDLVEGSPPVAAPAITGTVATGQTLTGVPNVTDDDNDTLGLHTYQWYRADNAAGTTNRVAVAGATTTSYAVTSADQGKYLVFEVVPKTTTGHPTIGSAASRVTAIAVPGTAPAITNLRIEGARAVVGATVRLEYTFNDAENDAESTTYTWCRKGVACNIGTARDYTIQAADVGLQLDAQVTPRTSTGSPNVGTMVTAPGWPTSGTITAEAAPTATPTITGTLTRGQLLTGNVGYNDANQDPEGTHTYQWYRATDAAGTSRTAITGATAKTYTVVEADEGKYIVFEVVPKSTTGTPNTGVATRVVSALVNGSAPVAQTPSISGTMKTGSQLTANYTFFDAENDDQDTSASGTSFQWYRHKPGSYMTNISGATSKDYTLTGDDQGDHYIGVHIIPRAATGSPKVGAQVSADSTIKFPGVAPTASPTISGSPHEGNVLTGVPGLTDANGDNTSATTYQWYRTDTIGGARTPSSGATNQTYTPVRADFRKYLVFEVAPMTTSGTPSTGEVVRVSANSPVRSSFSSPGDDELFTGTHDFALTVSGHSGNATSDAWVYFKIAGYPSQITKISAQLIAPDGTAYNLGTPGGLCGGKCGDKNTQVDLSSEGLNGTWTLRVTNSNAVRIDETLLQFTITF